MQKLGFLSNIIVFNGYILKNTLAGLKFLGFIDLKRTEKRSNMMSLFVCHRLLPANTKLFTKDIRKCTKGVARKRQQVQDIFSLLIHPQCIRHPQPQPLANDSETPAMNMHIDCKKLSISASKIAVAIP